MITLWTEKYRPKTVEEYVFRDEDQKRQIQNWIKEGTIPHLLLSGGPGIGKTTLAKMLLHEIKIPDYDILEINASRERGIDEVRDRITNFISMMPFGPFKVVLLDEADYLTPPAQASLRGVMEEYANTSRFILTCNRPNMIMDALHSRCQTMHFSSIDQDDFTVRVATILSKEGVSADVDTLDKYIKSTYPDLRKCINFVQQNVIDKKLGQPNKSDGGVQEWKPKMVDLFKKRQISAARKMICSTIRPEEIETVYRWLYDNLDLISTDEDVQDQAIVIIKQGLVDHTLVADPEINLSATMIKLGKLGI